MNYFDLIRFSFAGCDSCPNRICFTFAGCDSFAFFIRSDQHSSNSPPSATMFELFDGPASEPTDEDGRFSLRPTSGAPPYSLYRPRPPGTSANLSPREEARQN